MRKGHLCHGLCHGAQLAATKVFCKGTVRNHAQDKSLLSNAEVRATSSFSFGLLKSHMELPADQPVTELEALVLGF